MVVATDHHPLVGSVNLNYVEWRSGGHAQTLALSHSEVVNAGVLADDFAVRGYQVTRRVGQSLGFRGRIAASHP